MRFTELMLERYGAFAERTLPISGAGLTIVYGPNEAGKSTCLAAVSDFLFGIPERTPYGSLFGYDGMRVGASLVDSAGTHLTLRRRRGRGRTLTDADGTPVDDAVLGRLLGPTNRDRFVNLFGLNHESLRTGGSRLLDADGDIGRLIVEAGGGLRSLLARLDALDVEADKLFAPRKSGERTFYRALESFEAADREVKQNLVSSEAYEQARRAFKSAEERIATLRAERQAILAEQSTLERLRRALPHLLAFARIEAALLPFSDIDGLSGDFHEKAHALLDGQRVAAEALETAAVERDRLVARHDGMAFDAPLLNAEVEIRDLVEQAVHIRKARIDRPNRQVELQEAEAGLAALRRMLGLALDADLADRLPGHAALERVQTLANEAIERGSTLKGAEERVDDIDQRIAVLEERTGTALAQGFDQPAGFTAAQFGGLAQLAASSEAMRRQADAAYRELNAALEALGYATMEALGATRFPSIDIVRAERDWHNEVATELAGTFKARLAAEANAATSQEAIGAIEAGGPVASAEALADARGAREASWSPVRIAYLGNMALPEDGTRQQQVETYEAQIASADDLADRRADEAERVAKLELLRTQAAASRIAIDSSDTLIADLEARRDARISTFARAYPDAAAQYTLLPALLDHVEARAQIAEAREAARALEQKAELGAAELAPLQQTFDDAMAAHNLGETSGLPLASQVQQLVSRIQRHDTEHADYRRDMRDLGELGPRRERARQELAAVQGARDTWNSQWEQALAALGVTTELAPDRGGALVTEWSSARGALAAIETTRQRLRRMDEDETALRLAITGLAGRLEIDIPDDPASAVDLVNDRWKVQNSVREQQRTLAPEVEAARATHAARVTAEAKTRGAVDELVELAAAVKPGLALADVANRGAERAQLVAEQTRLEHLLADVGDGYAVSDLRQLLDGRDQSVLDSAHAMGRERAEAIDHEIEEAIVAQKDARDSLEAFAAETVVNSAMAARETAAAQMQGSVERYVELKIARGLISKAIDRLRHEQQDPLIARAGALFACTTEGEFAGIETDIDDKGHPVVVGRRRSGGLVPVSAMSDGTRDQLFLSFRLASLENYGSAAEPLPFVADDLLVHFDDERSKATLDLLAEFGKTNQVLLFTHHRKIADAAERLAADELATLVSIDRNA